MASSNIAFAGSFCDRDYATGDYKKALVSCEQKLTKLSTDDKGGLFLKLIDIANELGERKKQKLYLNALKKIPSFSSTPLYQFKWNSWNGILNYYNDNIELAEKYFHEELSIALLNKNKKWQAKSYNDLGVIVEEKGDYKLALENYVQSIKLYKEIGNNYKIGIGYHNIGLIYSSLEEYKKAKEYFNFSLEYYKKYQQTTIQRTKASKQIKHAYESLLQISLKTNDLASTNKYSSLIITPESPNTENLDHSIFDFVRLYIAQEKYDLAAYFLSKADDVLKNNDNKFNTDFFYLKARLHQKRKQVGLAIDELKTGLKHIKEGNFIALSKYYLLLSELYEKSDKEKSLNFLKKHHKQREHLLEKKYNSSIKTIQFKTEKNKIENDLNKEKLKRVTAVLKIKTLNNKFLISSIIVFILFSILLNLYFAKRREQRQLKNKIKQHKEQLLFLTEKSDERDYKKNTSICKEDFNRYLVKTMNNALMIWEKHTRTNRIELADQSKIWTISIDDGTLRTRSLDKYLSIDKIPKNPRWRNVVRTCHFVLSDSTLDKSSRKKLEKNLSSLISLFQKV